MNQVEYGQVCHKGAGYKKKQGVSILFKVKKEHEVEAERHRVVLGQ